MDETTSRVAELLQAAEQRTAKPADADTALANAERYTLAAGEASQQLMEALRGNDMAKIADRESVVKQMTEAAKKALAEAEQHRAKEVEEEMADELKKALASGDMGAIKEAHEGLAKLVNRNWRP